MEHKDALLQYTLRMSDNALILGHRLSELCSRAPFLEEDLALTNISLDMIGRAQALLGYAASVEGKGRTDDDLAYRRPEPQYRNHLLVEQPNGDFACTIARQLFISVFDYFFYTGLTGSKDQTLAAIAAKTVKEARYHMEHAKNWTLRLGDGTAESKQRMQRAVDSLWMYTGELFEMDDTDLLLLREGIAVDVIPIRLSWQQFVSDTLAEATLSTPEDVYMQTGSRKGIHTEHLGHILSEMQYLQRAYPDAKW